MIIMEKFNKFFGDAKLTLATEIPKLKYYSTSYHEKNIAAMISVKILWKQSIVTYRILFKFKFSWILMSKYIFSVVRLCFCACYHGNKFFIMLTCFTQNKAVLSFILIFASSPSKLIFLSFQLGSSDSPNSTNLI